MTQVNKSMHSTERKVANMHPKDGKFLFLQYGFPQ